MPFNIAGKTGTAQVADKGIKYSDRVYQGSFVGYFPAEEPKYTVAVVVRTKPHSGAYYGGTVAAPVFRMVADKMKIGRTMEAALQDTADRLGTAEFQFFVITLAIQRETPPNARDSEFATRLTRGRAIVTFLMLLIGALAYGEGTARDEHVKVGVLVGTLTAALLAERFLAPFEDETRPRGRDASSNDDVSARYR